MPPRQPESKHTVFYDNDLVLDNRQDEDPIDTTAIQAAHNIPRLYNNESEHRNGQYRMVPSLQWNQRDQLQVNWGFEQRQQWLNANPNGGGLRRRINEISGGAAVSATARYNNAFARQRNQEYGTIATTQPPAAGGGEPHPIYPSTGGILPDANTG